MRGTSDIHQLRQQEFQRRQDHVTCVERCAAAVFLTTLATDSLSDNHFCLGVSQPLCIVTVDSCALEILLLTYLLTDTDTHIPERLIDLDD